MIDVATIKIKAGNGGDGKVSFLREKFAPNGGPDGGDGGHGGSVFFVADHNLATLMDFRSKSLFAAENGVMGGKKNMYGPAGKDLEIKIPVGTLIYEIKEGKEVLVGDMTESGQRLLIAQGGRGGKGNFKFRSSTNQTPVQYTPGIKGEAKEIKLEVKLMADVGFIGLPNAGKSTLLNQLTKANAKIGSYPFTTLSPNLGVLNLKNGQSVVVADIPGLIEGASEGKGLGDEFLRHIQRTRVLVHLIEPFYNNGSGEEYKPEVVMDNYKAIRNELIQYGKGLENKPEIVVLNKIDVTEVREGFEGIRKKFAKASGRKKGVELLGISAFTGEGCDVLRDKIMHVLDVTPKTSLEHVAEPIKLYTVDNLPNKRMVFSKPEEMDIITRIAKPR